MKKVTLNKQQKLYVIPCGNGYTCLGFDVCITRLTSLVKEMQVTVKDVKRGTIAAYKEYMRLIDVARDKNKLTGWKSESELIPEFIGREGQRVEVVTSYGETERYYIGKSGGFIPIHLEIKKSNSRGGGAVCGHPFKKITFLNSFK